MGTIREVQESFKSLTDIRLAANSRLRMFNILEEVGAEKFLNIFRSYEVSDSVTDNEEYFDIHLVEADDWWENIAYKYYGTAKLWWVIPLMNQTLNPFEALGPGDRIKVLKKKYVYILLKDVENIAEL